MAQLARFSLLTAAVLSVACGDDAGSSTPAASGNGGSWVGGSGGRGRVALLRAAPLALQARLGQQVEQESGQSGYGGLGGTSGNAGTGGSVNVPTLPTKIDLL